MSAAGSPTLSDEIAAIAARLIAEDGLDYAGAKRRAAREVLGNDGRRDCLPDNERIEAAVREYQALFMADTQPARLAHLRRTALDVMGFLDGAIEGLHFDVVGAVVSGTAGEHSDIHLQVRDDNAKDIEIHLINAGIDFDAVADDFGGETLSFLWPPGARPGGPCVESVHLAVIGSRRGRSGKSVDRADRRGLERLLAESASG